MLLLSFSECHCPGESIYQQDQTAQQSLPYWTAGHPCCQADTQTKWDPPYKLGLIRSTRSHDLAFGTSGSIGLLYTLQVSLPLSGGICTKAAAFQSPSSMGGLDYNCHVDMSPFRVYHSYIWRSAYRSSHV